MSSIDRTLWRAAAHLHAFLRRNKSEAVSRPPTDLWQQCLQLAASVELAAQLNWQHAAHCRQVDSVSILGNISRADPTVVGGSPGCCPIEADR